MEDVIKILIADDKERFRNFIIENLKPYPVKVIGEASNGIEVLRLLKHLQPQVLLLDLEMPVMDGNKAFDIIRRDFPEMKVLIISSYYEDILMLDFFERGAKGYMPKDVMMPDLLYGALKRISDGETFFYEDPKRVRESYTSRQREILPFIFEGKTNREIASEVHISERAVEKRRTKIYQKNGVVKALDFYKLAFAKGLQFMGRQKMPKSDSQGTSKK